MLFKTQLSRLKYFVNIILKGEVKVARDVQDRGRSTVEKQASRIINTHLYCEYISLTDLNQNLFACTYLTCPFSHWSLLHGAGFDV